MDSIIIFILAIVLIGLLIANYIKLVKTENSTTTASCSKTKFGCCPNGLDTKINYYGTNCPGYIPPPPPPPTPPPPVCVPPPPGYLSRPVIHRAPLPPPPHNVPPPPHPIYHVPRPIIGCAKTIYGCCPDNMYAKIDPIGSNCLQ